MAVFILIMTLKCLCFEEYKSLRFLMNETQVVFGEIRDMKRLENKQILIVKILDFRNVKYHDSMIEITFISNESAFLNLTQRFYLIELHSENKKFLSTNILGLDTSESYFRLKRYQKEWQILRMFRSENDKKNLLAQLTLRLISDTIFRYDISRFILKSPNIDSLKLFWSELSKSQKQSIQNLILTEEKLSKRDLPLLYLLNNEFHNSINRKLKESIYKRIHENEFDDEISSMMIGFIELSSRYDLLSYYYESMNYAYFDYSQGRIMFHPIKMKQILTQFFYSIEKSI